jgi:phosphatidylglycerophosphate synthase
MNIAPKDPQAPASRRPLASRNSGWAKSLASRLVVAGVRPNRISQGSIVAAALGTVFFAASPFGAGFIQGLLLLLAAGAAQARLICNLLDGMVAIEGGLAEKNGPFWNEAPDRVADLLLIGGAGIAAGNPALGFLAAALAMATAYVRELGRAEGFSPDYSGPMAKPHRMAALTIGTVVAAFAPLDSTSEGMLNLTLWIIVIGSAATIIRRSLRLISALSAR